MIKFKCLVQDDVTTDLAFSALSIHVSAIFNFTTRLMLRLANDNVEKCETHQQALSHRLYCDAMK